MNEVFIHVLNIIRKIWGIDLLLSLTYLISDLKDTATDQSTIAWGCIGVTGHDELEVRYRPLKQHGDSLSKTVSLQGLPA